MDRVTVAIGIGSNQGSREAHVEFARHRLSELLSDVRFSASYETAPFGVPDGQPMFLNAAAIGRTALTARDLLAALLAIERARGRTRVLPRAARTLDLDLVLFGNAIIADEGLSVPHPRFRERTFVLGPLAEIAPDLLDPVTGRSVADLLSDLRPGQ